LRGRSPPTPDDGTSTNNTAPNKNINITQQGETYKIIMLLYKTCNGIFKSLGTIFDYLTLGDDVKEKIMEFFTKQA